MQGAGWLAGMRRLLFLTAFLAASPLHAGPWVDDKGRSMELQFPGATPTVYRPNGHTIADGVALFDAACRNAGFNKKATEAAVSDSGWNFTYQAEMMSFKEPVDVGGWNARDATIRMANGIFFNKKSQCSLVFAPQGGSNVSEVQEALSTLLGSAPSNADKQFDKKGNPKKYYTPEWTIAGADGGQLKVFALPLPYNNGAIQIAVLKIQE